MEQHPSSFRIGLAGGSGSGKSTFSSALIQALTSGVSPLSAAVISTDGYFLPHEAVPRFISPTLGQSLPDYNRPDSIDAQRLVADIDARAGAADHPAVLVVEGLMVLHLPEVRERLDLRLFIELDADQRALRRMVRNLGHHYDPSPDTSPEGIANYFLESAKVGHEKYVEPSRRFADLVLRGDGDFQRTAPMVAEIARGWIARRRQGD